MLSNVSTNDIFSAIRQWAAGCVCPHLLVQPSLLTDEGQDDIDRALSKLRVIDLNVPNHLPTQRDTDNNPGQRRSQDIIVEI